MLDLTAFFVDLLPEVARAAEQCHEHDRQLEIRTRPHGVACEHAETTRVGMYPSTRKATSMVKTQYWSAEGKRLIRSSFTAVLNYLNQLASIYEASEIFLRSPSIVRAA